MDVLVPSSTPTPPPVVVTGADSAVTNTLIKFFESRAHPPPSRRTVINRLLLGNTDNSPGYKAFLVQYRRLAKQKITSKHAYNLFTHARRAEDATMMYSHVEALKNNRDASDAACHVQLSLHMAVEWVRRFGETRHTKDWFEEQESLELAEVISRLKFETDKLVALVHAGSMETARNLVAIRQKAWDKQDDHVKKIAERSNAQKMKDFRALLAKSEAAPPGPAKVKLTKKANFANRELLDSYSLSAQDLAFLQETKTRLGTDAEAPPFRKDGIRTLGPFSINGNVAIKVEVKYTEGTANGVYTVLSGGPKGDSLAAYQATLGSVVSGPTSPRNLVSYPLNHPQRKLLRIPPNAYKFAFLFPVITTVQQITFENMSSFDMLLLYGGYIYWDVKGAIIQCNSLWPGSNLQFSSPKKLTTELQAALDQADRWENITLETLDKIGAKKFTWFLPSEFPGLSGIDAPHGAFAYKYADERVNNYFALGSAESVLGTLKATSMRDMYTKIDKEDGTEEA